MLHPESDEIVYLYVCNDYTPLRFSPSAKATLSRTLSRI